MTPSGKEGEGLGTLMEVGPAYTEYGGLGGQGGQGIPVGQVVVACGNRGGEASLGEVEPAHISEST